MRFVNMSSPAGLARSRVWFGVEVGGVGPKDTYFCKASK